jgi:hypothetical protein
MTVHLALGGAPEQQAELDNDTLQNSELWTEMDHDLHNHERSMSEGMINFPPPLNGTTFRSQSESYYAPMVPQDQSTLFASLANDTMDEQSMSEGMINFPPPLNGSTFRSQSESYYAPMVPQDPSTLFASLANDAMDVTQPMSSSFPDWKAVAQQMTMWTSVPNLVGSNTTATVTLPPIEGTSMDVVFSRDGGSISSSAHAGNNRFRILIDLQRKPYQDAGKNIEQKERVLDDILQSVNSWKSRFWIETDIEYWWINEEQAKECLRRIFNVQTLRNKEIDLLKARKARKEESHALTSK